MTRHEAVGGREAGPPETARAERRADRRAVALIAAMLLVAATAAAVPADVARAAPPILGSGSPALGSWVADGPTRTIVDSVTPLGARTTVLLAQSVDGVRRSADGGRTWTRPSGLPRDDAGTGVSSSVLAVLAGDRDRAWLATSGTSEVPPDDAGGDEAGDDTGVDEVDGPVLYATTDAGATWAPVPGDALAGRIVVDLAVVPVALGDPVLLAADATAGILRSDDGGRTFAPAVDGIAPDPDVGDILVGGLAAGSGQGAAFASTTNAIWRTADGGLSWVAACVTTETLPCGRPVVAPGAPSLVLGVGFGGVVRSADGGTTWLRAGAGTLPGPDDGGVDAVVFSGDPEPIAWASGPRGLFRSADGGVSWQSWDGGLGGPEVAASDRLAIDPASRARGWRIHGLAFFATTDGGRSWAELPGPDPTGVPAYAALADRQGARVVGTDGGIVVRTEARWAAARDDAIATDLSRGPWDGAAAVYAATYAAGVLRSADGGLTWDDWSRGLPRTPAWAVVAPGDPDGRALLATDSGAFERATDAPRWAPLGIGLPDAAVRALVAVPDGSVLAGLETRGLWRLPRGLDEWRPAGLQGRTVLSLAVASTDGRVVLAATAGQGLWRSADAGRTWQRVGSTRTTADVAWDPATRTAVLATGPAVLASSDGGRSWRAFAVGLPASDPARPWARSATSVRAGPEGGFVLTTLGGTYLARPEAAPVPLPAGAAASPTGPAAAAAVVTRGYDLGRAQLSVLGEDGRPHRLPTRLVGEITMPAGATGRLPVVVILHGAHQSCAEGPGGTVSSDYPCLPGWQPVASHAGYRYLAERLAREGFLVVSVDGRPVAPFDHTDRPFPDGSAAGVSTWMDLRARIVDAHLRRLARAGAGATGPDVDFGIRLAGRIDAANVGLVGHSRGGEGVVWASLLDGWRPYRVRSIVAIAPTDFADRVVPGDVPFAVVLPTCDGDVSDLQGARFFDTARNTPRIRPLLQVAVHGANHDFFNEVWPDEWGFAAAGTIPTDPGGACDPGGAARLTRPRQESVGGEIVSAFLRGTLRDDGGALASLGIGARPPRAITGVAVTVRTQEPTARRIDVVPNDGSPYALSQTAGGGRITPVGLAYLGLCRPGARSDAIEEGADPDDRADACPPGWFPQAQSAEELRIAWTSPGGRLLLAPSPRPVDLRGVVALSLATAPTPPEADPELNGPGGARPFSVALVDAAGRRAVVPVSSAEPAVRAWPTLTVLGTIRIPVSRFGGVDLGRIARVELVFDRTPRGAVIVTDLAFLR
ncbi:MAG: hypothetical protein MUE82_01440 [Chloroflexi bacterium]|nr:hypothetical protein [Chloroflexota bacterium]